MFAQLSRTASVAPMEFCSGADPSQFTTLSSESVNFWPLELGAEVVCCEGDSPTKRLTRQPSPGKPCVPNVAALTRRCSYEEVVHTEIRQQKVEDNNSFENMSLKQCLQAVAQWALTLREVLEDRSRTGLLDQDHSTECVCRKAQVILAQLHKIEACFSAVLEQCAKNDTRLEHYDRFYLENLWISLNQMQETLRMNVSIQISNPGRDIIAKSRSIVAKIANARAYVHDALTSIAKLINDLLLVSLCQIHNNNTITTSAGVMERDGEGDIRSRVASLMSEDKSRDRDDVTMDDSTLSSSDKHGRKRKQIFPKINSSVSSTSSFCAQNLNSNGRLRRTPPTSPTSASSPSKRPRRLSRPNVSWSSGINSSPISMTSSRSSSVASSRSSSPTSTSPSTSPALELLETNKKGQREGLYKWVLWREALKGEKDRRVSSSPCPPGSPTLSACNRSPNRTSWRQLSFS